MTAKNHFLSRQFLIPFFTAGILRVLPLFWGREVFDVRLYRYQAIAVLDHVNPYLYSVSPAFSTVRHPYVYFPFSMFYAPACLWFSQWTGVSFAAVIKWTPVALDLCLLAVLYDCLSKQNPRLAVRAAWIYALCPVAILISAFHGNVIVGPTLLTLCSLLFFEEAERLSGDPRLLSRRLSALILGLAIAWRTYPVLLLPVFLLKSSTVKEARHFLFFAVLPVVVTTLPFLCMSPVPLLKALSYTGYNGSVGWHMIPVTAAGSLFLHTPFFLDLQHFGQLLVNRTHTWDKAAFAGAYTAVLFLLRKRMDALRLILLSYLLLYFLMTTVAQQYFIWVLPFLFLWSVPLALVYSVLCGLVLLVIYWAIFPEILFGTFSIVRLPVPAEYWSTFVFETAFWVFLGFLIFKLLFLEKNTSPRAFSAPFGSFLNEVWKKRCERAIYALIVLAAFFEIVYIFSLDAQDPWRVVKTISIETPQKELTGHKIIRYRPWPKVAATRDDFLWFDPSDRTLKAIDQEGRVLSKIVLKHPQTGERLNLFDIEADAAGGFFVVSDLEKGFLGEFDTQGRFILRLGENEIRAPSSIARSADGTLAVLDAGSQALFVLGRDGKILKKFPYSFKKRRSYAKRYDVGIDRAGSIYLLDSIRQCVCVFDSSSGAERRIPVRVFSPEVQLAVNPEGFFSVLNVKTTQIDFYSPEGRYVAKLDNGPDASPEPRLPEPFAVLMDAKNNIWIADAWKFELLKVEFSSDKLHYTK